MAALLQAVGQLARTVGCSLRSGGSTGVSSSWEQLPQGRFTMQGKDDTGVQVPLETWGFRGHPLRSIHIPVMKIGQIVKASVRGTGK